MDKDRITIKKIIYSYKYVTKILFLVDGPKAFLLFVISILSGVFPSLSTLLMQKILNFLQRENKEFQEIIYFIAFYIGISFLTNVFKNIQGYFSPLLRERVKKYVSLEILKKVSEVNLATFEDSEVFDKIQRAQGQTGERFFDYFMSLLSVFQYTIQIVIQFFIFLAWRPWLVSFIILISIINSAYSFYMDRKHYNILYGRTEKERKKWYYQYLLTKDLAFKEVKIYSLAKLFLKKSNEIYEDIYEQDREYYRGYILGRLLLALLEETFTSFIFIWIIVDCVMERILVGDAITFIKCIGQIISGISGVLLQFEFSYKETLHLEQYFELMKLQSEEDGGMEIDSIDRIELINVSYKYRGKDDYALYKVNLVIDRKMIFVGRNGSGKSTLVKILTGLYDGYEGTILINSIDMKKLSKATLQKKIAVLFQDFNKYEMTVRENVYLGDLEKEKDIPRILRSLQAMGAPFCTEENLDKQLGVWFDNGSQLSGGEWLKIGLSRVLFREADVYVLDEPNAALDPISEQEILENIDKLIQNRIAIIITHRINNVIRANRDIVVFKKGKIVGVGKHDELIQNSAEYREIYRSSVKLDDGWVGSVI